MKTLESMTVILSRDLTEVESLSEIMRLVNRHMQSALQMALLHKGKIVLNLRYGGNEVLKQVILKFIKMDDLDCCVLQHSIKGSGWLTLLL